MVQELTVRLQLDDMGVATWETPRINGILKTITVIPGQNNQIQMRVSTAYELILNEISIHKTRIFAPAIQTSTNDGQMFSQNCVEWTLNDVLFFKLSGGKEKIVDLIVRWI